MSRRRLVVVLSMIGGVCLLLVLGLGWLGMHLYHATSGFVGRAVPCRGRVVAMGSRLSDDGDGGATTVYYPIFNYVDAAGAEHQGASSTASNPPAWKVDDSVPLLYDPRNPQDWRINSFWRLWLGPIICAACAVPPLLFGTFMFFVIAFILRRVDPRPAGIPAALPAACPVAGPPPVPPYGGGGADDPWERPWETR